jgi:viologen exporter family transport system permease protein
VRYARLFAAFVRAELQFSLAYRVNLLLEAAQDLVTVCTSAAAVLVLYSHTSQINGWSLPQMVVLLGVYYLIQGAQSCVFEVSFERFMEHVRLGTLDFVLLKPANTQFLVSVRNVQVAQLAQVGFGAVVLAIGLAQIGEHVSFGDALSFALTLMCGLALVYCLLLVLSTLAFWFVRVENILAIFWACLDAGRFPVDIYPGWLRVTLSSVVPIGIAVTVPAEAIAGRLDPAGLLGMLAGTAAAWWFSGWFWQRGLRTYTGASA